MVIYLGGGEPWLLPDVEISSLELRSLPCAAKENDSVLVRELGFAGGFWCKVWQAWGD